MNAFYIDTYTKSHKVLLRRLGSLKATVRVMDDGVYRECPDNSRIYLESSWSEEELDGWLYRTNGIDYVGVCTTEVRGE